MRANAWPYSALMGIVWAIARRDLLQMFSTPLAWLVLFAWAMVTNGLFFLTGIEPGSGDLPLYQPLFVTALDGGAWLLTLLAPAITMNTFAAERNQGTMQLLLTVPVAEWQLVLGKFFASFVMLATMVAVTLVQIVVLYLVSSTGGMQVVAGYLGLLLVAGLFAALGTWISSLVESPVAAYVITFGIIAVLHLFGLSASGDGWFAGLGSYLGISPHQQPFTQGDVRLGNVVWFLSMSGVFLALAHGSLKARRIHG
ncbi:MAG: hypothetical protein EA402_12465 [Planctomycetota bacterium]|nr:MAG: hypothetical protein EA402_12465 [Planctomycetota bacterium]